MLQNRLVDTAKAEVVMTERPNALFDAPKVSEQDLSGYIDPILTETRNRSIRSFLQPIGYVDYYALQPRYNDDKLEEYTEYLIQTSEPDKVKMELVSLTRCLLPVRPQLPMFEGSSPEYKFDSDVKSAIYGKLRVQIYDEDGAVKHQHTYTIGLYPCCISKKHRDARGNVRDSEYIGIRNVFYIPDNKKQIEVLVSSYGLPHRQSVTKIGYQGSNTGNYAIPNFEEWKTEDISLLISANEKGLLSDVPSGALAMKQYQNIIQKMIEEGIPSALVSNLTRQDILEILKSRDIEQAKHYVKNKK